SDLATISYAPRIAYLGT
ncbi:hypothetical protein D044_4071B, partial [Vibrio parahaemolyticus EKP-026]